MGKNETTEREMNRGEINYLLSLIEDKEKDEGRYIPIGKLMVVVGVVLFFLSIVFKANILGYQSTFDFAGLFFWCGLAITLFSLLPLIIGYASRSVSKEFKSDFEIHKIKMYEGLLKKRTQYVSSRYGGTTYYYLSTHEEPSVEFNVEEELWNKIQDLEIHKIEYLPVSKVITSIDNSSMMDEGDYRDLWLKQRDMKTRSFTAEDTKTINETCVKTKNVGTLMLIVGSVITLSTIISFFYMIFTIPSQDIPKQFLLMAPFLVTGVIIIGIFLAVKGKVKLEGITEIKQDLTEDRVFIYKGHLRRTPNKPYWVGFPWEGDDLQFKVNRGTWELINKKEIYSVEFLSNRRKILYLNGDLQEID